MDQVTHVELAHHPLDDARTDRFEVAFAPTTTLAHLVADGARVRAIVDGEDVPPEDWTVTVVSGRAVRLEATAERDLLRTGLQIAVVAAALYVGGPAGAAIAIGGNLAVNALFPPPIPDLGGAGADQVYSLNAASSRPRPRVCWPAAASIPASRT